MALLIAALSVSYVDNVCGLLHGLWETNTLALLPSLLRHLTKCAMHFFSHHPFWLLGDWLMFILDPAHFLLFISLSESFLFLNSNTKNYFLNYIQKLIDLCKEA